MDHPVRTVGSDVPVGHRPKCMFVSEKYSLFDQAVKNTEALKPVVFDESIHLSKPFENASQRYRYFSAMQLSVQVELFKYCPEGRLSLSTLLQRFRQTDLRTKPLFNQYVLLLKLKVSCQNFTQVFRRRPLSRS